MCSVHTRVTKVSVPTHHTGVLWTSTHSTCFISLYCYIITKYINYCRRRKTRWTMYCPVNGVNESVVRRLQLYNNGADGCSVEESNTCKSECLLAPGVSRDPDKSPTSCSAEDVRGNVVTCTLRQVHVSPSSPSIGPSSRSAGYPRFRELCARPVSRGKTRSRYGSMF